MKQLSKRVDWETFGFIAFVSIAALLVLIQAKGTHDRLVKDAEKERVYNTRVLQYDDNAVKACSWGSLKCPYLVEGIHEPMKKRLAIASYKANTGKDLVYKVK